MRIQQHPFCFLLIVALLCGLNACLKFSDPSFSSTHPDEVLFDRAMFAGRRAQFDVARMTLETLVNTYPDSAYVSKSELVLEDLKTAPCVESSDAFIQCTAQHSELLPDQ